jgi:prepilin-type N-terminal cleavage/methylation domain-containing protein
VRRSSPSLAFTLIELLVVLVIISLTAATVVLSSTGIWRQASIESSITRLEALDQHMRAFARARGQSCALEFDTSGQHVRKLYEPAKRPDQPATGLGRGLKLERVHLAGVSSSRRKVTVPFNAAGMSPSYALEFKTTSDQRFWLLFAGVGGQSIRIPSEKDLHAALQLISP